MCDFAAVVVGAIPTPDCEYGQEDIEGDDAAEDSEDGWREKPGCLEEMKVVESRIGPDETGE